MGLEYLPSQANFILVNVGMDGEEVFKALMREGVIVRAMKAYGLGNWIRVTVGRRSQNSRFYHVLKRYLKTKKAAVSNTAPGNAGTPLNTGSDTNPAL